MVSWTSCKRFMFAQFASLEKNRDFNLQTELLQTIYRMMRLITLQFKKFQSITDIPLYFSTDPTNFGDRFLFSYGQIHLMNLILARLNVASCEMNGAGSMSLVSCDWQEVSCNNTVLNPLEILVVFLMRLGTILEVVFLLFVEPKLLLLALPESLYQIFRKHIIVGRLLSS